MRGLVICLVFTVAVALAAASGRAEELKLAVIVHPERSETLTRQDLTRIYLKERRLWADGAPIVAVNREPGSLARETFSAQILGGDSAQFSRYWNQRYFEGVFPPLTLSSEAAVKRYVATNRDAIGYIDAKAVDGSVRVVLRLDPPS